MRGKMLIEEELARVAPNRETALTIGVFDGVHLGHQYLIQNLRQTAATENLLSGVVTFRHHPRLVLYPEVKLTYLTSLSERIRLLTDLGVELVVALSFSLELAQLGVREFVSLLQRHLKMRALVIGPDFALGRGREGDASALQALGQELNFMVEVVPAKLWQGEAVSSTAIRLALSQGDPRKVSQLLGRRFRLGGKVIKGDERGKVLGFPTANIAPDPEEALPADGVYATRAFVGQAVYKAVTNIGIRPTFGGGQRLIEVYLLDFEGDLYGQELEIELVECLRGEIRFASVEELKAQIVRDVEGARALLSS
jgi:riboflavin kinase/FMN adenylyltransferase